jgi:hypothetical protein
MPDHPVSRPSLQAFETMPFRELSAQAVIVANREIQAHLRRLADADATSHGHESSRDHSSPL